MACSAIATNCPAIVASCSRLAYCRIVACCTETVAALIESPRSPHSSSATGHSFWSSVAVGRTIARPRSRPFRSARASRFVPRSTANARPRCQNNSDPEPFPELSSALHSHTDGPVAAPRSWLGFPLVSLVVASVPPKNNRNSPANALVPSTVLTVSIPPKLRASSAARPGSAPSSRSSAVAGNNGHASPHTVPGARSPRTRRTPWPAPQSPPAVVWNKSSSALSHNYLCLLLENEPRPDQSLPPPGHADVLAPASSRCLRSDSDRRSIAAHPPENLPATTGPRPPSWLPRAPAPCDSGENILLLLPLRPSRGLLQACRTPTGSPNAIGMR